jgi:prepilin-type N-terminal cleavage/methylation domain-containing protein
MLIKLMSIFKKEKGFTLIELLVVIAIIGALSSVVLSSLNSARGKARDAKRQSELDSMNTALELFYGTYGRYPSGADGNCVWTQSFLPGGCLQVLVINNFMPSIPVDPISGQQYYYDNWCNIPAVFDDQHFRMWGVGEFNHDGILRNWWADVNIGFTNCIDPS